MQNIVVFVQNILMQQRNYTPRKSLLQNKTGNRGKVKQSRNNYIRIKYNFEHFLTPGQLGMPQSQH